MKDINKVTEERRKFFRIDDVAVLTYKVVSWADAHTSKSLDAGLLVDKFATKAHLDRLSRELQPLYKVIKSSNSNIAEYLSTLDKKISLLSECLMADEGAEQDIEPRKVNISGGGVLFVSDKPVASGAMLELRMKLLPKQIYVYSYAKVISCTEVDEGAEDQEYKIAVKFEHMEDDVRDLITRHVLVREQALINKA